MRPGQVENGRYTAEVIADNSGQWTGNQLRFDTLQNPRAYVQDLGLRWTLVRNCRVLEDSTTVVWQESPAS